jgi:glutamate-1-semialdehyde 2,1-aminomutase
MTNTITSTIGTGQALYQKAKNLIPGGTSLLSKRPEMFLPENWPSYYSKTKGCKIWDLDDKEYLDMCIMGIGTNILGYGNERVDEAVKEVVMKGNMSTLNCPEEVALAERLVQMHPWADMVRFARTGGEANAVAIRIARAAAGGRDKVAICGYHGWHDWYLSTNLSDKEGLDGHLLPGLNPAGVPKNLANTTLPFNYNKIEELEKIVAENPDLGVIKMEVSRNHGPLPGYLEAVRKIATDNNLVLIFDECTSGFRQTFGGLHKMYGVEPDMAMFGKALGNGYAITAIVGKKEVMQAAQKTFISSTFWTERIGPTAALATLDVMEEEKSWETITLTGSKITRAWKDLGEKYELSLNTAGLPSLTSFSIKSDNWLAYKTYITQEMLKKGILASNAVYVSVAHTQEHIDRYFAELEPLFKDIKSFEEGRNVYDLLEGPVSHGGFKRLN